MGINKTNMQYKKPQYVIVIVLYVLIFLSERVKRHDTILIVVKIKTGFKNFGLVPSDSEIGCLQALKDLPAVLIELYVPDLFLASLT